MPPEHQRVTRLAPLHDVHACIDTIAQPVTPKKMPVWQAAGRVLASDATAEAPRPASAVALVDGWAVASDRVSDAGPYAPVPLDSTPAWVECGDPLPSGADAVLAPDAVTFGQGRAEAFAAAAPGENIVPAGIDAGPGKPLCKAGERVRATDLAALRAAGIDRVWARAPRIHVVSASTHQGQGEGFVGALIADAVQNEGSGVSYGRTAGLAELEYVLTHEDSDAVIAVGGTGMGKGDGSVTMLARLGRVEIHGMGIRPGDTAALGTVAQRPVLILPGRLDAALATWLLVGRRLHARLTGAALVEAATRATLQRKIVSTIGLAEAIPVGYCEGGIEPLASGYLPLHALTRAAGWVFVPADSEGFPAGAIVEMRPLP